MAYENQGGGERQMHKGEWQCGECGATINELPFEPDPARLNQLKCRDCHRKHRQERFGR